MRDESRLGKGYLFYLFAADVRKEAGILSLVEESFLLGRVAVEKGVQGFAVAMKIDDDGNGGIFVDILHVFLNVVDLGVDILARGPPHAIQIGSSQIGPVVPIEHSIRVHHWEDIELNSFL